MPEQLQQVNCTIISSSGKIFFEHNVKIASPILNNSTVFLGSNSYMNTGGYIRGKVFIGRYCSIGRRITIGAGIHKMEKLSTSPFVRGCNAKAYSTNEVKLIHLTKRNDVVVIESDVWIGDGAIIIPGVTIGNGSIISANAVVTNDVMPHSIVAGVPAREISKRFDPIVSQKLLSSKWWEMDLDRLNKLPTSNVFEFLDKLVFESTQIPTYLLEK